MPDIGCRSEEPIARRRLNQGVPPREVQRTPNGTDSDDRGVLDIAEDIFTLTALRLGGLTFPAPGMEFCGDDGTEDELRCDLYLGEWFCAAEANGPPEVPGFTFDSFSSRGLPEYTHDQTGIEVVLLPGGKFDMGSPDTEPNRSDSEGPVHSVTLDSFLIGKTEVTQAQYEAVMGSNPSFFTGNAQRPVEQVHWNDLHAPGGFLARTGLELPSGAQWEYAARGGTITAFSFGDGDDCSALFCTPCPTANAFMWWCGSIEDFGNLNDPLTHPVGEKLPNPFGLFDMHGNVQEWCADVFTETFYGNPEAAGRNPVAASGSEERVVRGGHWGAHAPACRSASRRRGPEPGGLGVVTGFRVAAPLP